MPAGPLEAQVRHLQQSVRERSRGRQRRQNKRQGLGHLEESGHHEAERQRGEVRGGREGIDDPGRQTEPNQGAAPPSKAFAYFNVSIHRKFGFKLQTQQRFFFSLIVSQEYGEENIQISSPCYGLGVPDHDPGREALVRGREEPQHFQRPRVDEKVSALVVLEPTVKFDA